MVEDVKKLASKLKSHALTKGEGEVFESGEIEVDEIWAVERSPRGVAEIAGSGKYKATGIEKIVDGLLVAGKLATANPIRPILSRAIPAQGRSRTVYRTYEKREAGVDAHNGIHLPIP